MGEQPTSTSILLDRVDFNCIKDYDIVDMVTHYRQAVFGSKSWTIDPEQAVGIAVSNVCANSYDLSVTEDYMAIRKRQLNSALQLIGDLAGYSAIEWLTVTASGNQTGDIIVNLTDNDRYTVVVQLADHIGQKEYNENFLEPYRLIQEFKLDTRSKLDLIMQVNRMVRDMFDDICLSDPRTQVSESGVRLEKQLLGSYDFINGYTTFTDTLHYYMGIMAMLYCRVMMKLKFGEFVNGVFTTNYSIMRLALEDGYVVLIHCPDEENH